MTRSIIAALAAAVACAAAPALGAGHDRPTAGTLEAIGTAPTPAPVFVPGFRGTPGVRPAERLDAYGTVAYALAHAPSLAAQRAQILNLDSTFTRARAAEYPALGGQLQNQIARSANQVGSFGQFGISPSSNFSENTAQLQSSYALYNGSQQLLAQQAKKQRENARFELRRQEEQTAIAVSNGFDTLAADAGVVSLDENDLRYQQALLDTARAQERVGRIAGVDVLKAQVAVARSETALVQARAQTDNDREALAVQVGAPADSLFDVPAMLPEPPLPAAAPDVLVTMAEMNRPEIGAARSALDVSKLTDAAVDNDLRPTVNLSGSFGSQVSPTQFVQQQRQIDASNAAALASYNAQKMLFPTLAIAPPTLIPPVDRHVPGFWQFSIISTFAVPLYDYGQRAAAHHAARSQIDASLSALFNAYDSVQSDVDTSRRNLTAAARKLQLAKLSAQLGAETARIAQLQYRNGLISFTDVTQTQQTALAAQNDLIAARVQYVTAFVRLRVALAPPDTAAAADLRGL